MSALALPCLVPTYSSHLYFLECEPEELNNLLASANIKDTTVSCAQCTKCPPAASVTPTVVSHRASPFPARSLQSLAFEMETLEYKIRRARNRQKGIEEDLEAPAPPASKVVSSSAPLVDSFCNGCILHTRSH